MTCSAITGARTASGTASPIIVTGLSKGTTYLCAVSATNAAGTGSLSSIVMVTPVATVVASGAVDPTRFPVGNPYVRFTGAGVGYAFMCDAGNPGAGGATTKGPYFNSDGTTSFKSDDTGVP